MDATVNLFNHLNILTKAGERCQGPGQAFFGDRAIHPFFIKRKK